MKLKSIQVENYRSIVKTQRLELDEGLTVILGPNNEGKSNLLRAIVLAMNCLRATRTSILGTSASRSLPTGTFRFPKSIYDWESDFPQHLQVKKSPRPTTLILEFVLNESDKQRFKTLCGSNINDNLEIELNIAASQFEFKIKRKRGKGASSYSTKLKEISKFIATSFEFQYIPAIRPSELSLTVVSELLERELEALSDDREYQKALQTIEAIQKPVIDSISGDVQKYLKQLLPSVTSVKLARYNNEPMRSRIRLPQFIVDDGTATELEAKGDGIKSLVAISLMRASKTGDGFGDLVVAIEEPESHLHPGAIRQLASVLQDMAEEHQVIITTHSPLLIARDNLNSNIIVSKSKATPAKNIQEIRSSLGVEVSDNLIHAEFVVIVEGKHDVRLLSATMRSLSPEFDELVASGKVVFDEMYGTSNAPYKISTVRNSIATPILILDDDRAGRKSVKQITDADALDSKYIFILKSSERDETELEDLFDASVYWEELKEKFAVNADLKDFLTGRDKWSTRMKATFASSGKLYDDSTEANLKTFVASKVVGKGGPSLLPKSKGLMTNVTSAVTSLCSTK